MKKQAGNIWLVCSGLFFLWYCADVIVGKLALSTGEASSFTIGDVGEFLVLFAAVICLVVAMLIKESLKSEPN